MQKRYNSSHELNNFILRASSPKVTTFSLHNISEACRKLSFFYIYYLKYLFLGASFPPFYTKITLQNHGKKLYLLLACDFDVLRHNFQMLTITIVNQHACDKISCLWIKLCFSLIIQFQYIDILLNVQYLFFVYTCMLFSNFYDSII